MPHNMIPAAGRMAVDSFVLMPLAPLLHHGPLTGTSPGRSSALLMRRHVLASRTGQA